MLPYNLASFQQYCNTCDLFRHFFPLHFTTQAHLLVVYLWSSLPQQGLQKSHFDWLVPPMICISSITWEQKPCASCSTIMDFKDHLSPNYDGAGISETNRLESKCVADALQINPSPIPPSLPCLQHPDLHKPTWVLCALLTPSENKWGQIGTLEQSREKHQTLRGESQPQKTLKKREGFLEQVKATPVSMGVTTTSWSDELQHNIRVIVWMGI